MGLNGSLLHVSRCMGSKSRPKLLIFGDINDSPFSISLRRLNYNSYVLVPHKSVWYRQPVFFVFSSQMGRHFNSEMCAFCLMWIACLVFTLSEFKVLYSLYVALWIYRFPIPLGPNLKVISALSLHRWIGFFILNLFIFVLCR